MSFEYFEKRPLVHSLATDIPCFYLAELEFKRARETLFTLELHKDKRGQTFFNIEFGTYLALETSNSGSSFIFLSPLNLWGQILPNLTFQTPKWLFQVKCRYHYSKIFVS